MKRKVYILGGLDSTCLSAAAVALARLESQGIEAEIVNSPPPVAPGPRPIADTLLEVPIARTATSYPPPRSKYHR